MNKALLDTDIFSEVLKAIDVNVVHNATAIAVEEVLDFGVSAAELAGQISGELERIGRPIGMADPMIAAVALTHGVELVTGNTTHFQRIQQLGYPLVLTNWRV